MNTVHISTIDVGGAYKAAVRICRALEKNGHKSELILRTKTQKEGFGVPYFSNDFKGRLGRFFSKAGNVLNQLLSVKGLDLELFGTDISKDERVLNADVIYLHWVNSFLSLKSIKKLLELNKPVVWVMHDMWLLTGGCHYDHYCEGYKTECRACPLGGGNRAHRNYKNKVSVFSEHSNLTIVGISNWMSAVSKQSGITEKINNITIYNPIDTSVFKPISSEEREKIRKDLGLSYNAKMVLCGAMENTGNATKGFAYLRDALNMLPTDYEIVFFGNSAPREELKLNNQVILCGMIEDEDRLSKLYASSDVFVTASIEEGFGYTVSESLSCGTPVAAFFVGGIAEQVIHKENGYLAQVRDAKGLADGIIYICENANMKSDGNISKIRNDYEHIGRQYANIG